MSSARSKQLCVASFLFAYIFLVLHPICADDFDEYTIPAIMDAEQAEGEDAVRFSEMSVIYAKDDFSFVLLASESLPSILQIACCDKNGVKAFVCENGSIQLGRRQFALCGNLITKSDEETQQIPRNQLHVFDYSAGFPKQKSAVVLKFEETVTSGPIGFTTFTADRWWVLYGEKNIYLVERETQKILTLPAIHGAKTRLAVSENIAIAVKVDEDRPLTLGGNNLELKKYLDNPYYRLDLATTLIAWLDEDVPQWSELPLSAQDYDAGKNLCIMPIRNRIVLYGDWGEGKLGGSVYGFDENKETTVYSDKYQGVISVAPYGRTSCIKVVSKITDDQSIVYRYASSAFNADGDPLFSALNVGCPDKSITVIAVSDRVKVTSTREGDDIALQLLYDGKLTNFGIRSNDRWEACYPLNDRLVCIWHERSRGKNLNKSTFKLRIYKLPETCYSVFDNDRLSFIR